MLTKLPAASRLWLGKGHVGTEDVLLSIKKEYSSKYVYF